MLERYGVELIGANVDAIRKAEDRDLFKEAMLRIGLDLPRSGFAHEPGPRPPRCCATSGCRSSSARRARSAAPAAASPTTDEEFGATVAWGLEASPIREILIEESIAGWKEFELEVMRDTKDNVVIVCSIENFDPMGVHTGDSITVAPAQTLTDKEYQIMRDAALAIIRAIGVDTGGSNIQFAVHPQTGRLVVIEMNPRVSRSSALATKATGFPIAKIAAKLAVGYTLDEIPNDITRETPACFEPTIDYVVTKIPRFTFEKFPPGARRARHADEVGRRGDGDRPHVQGIAPEGDALARDRSLRLRARGRRRSLAGRARAEAARAECTPPVVPRRAFRRGMTTAELFALTKIDPWFLRHVRRDHRRRTDDRRRAEPARRGEAARAEADGLRRPPPRRPSRRTEQEIRARRLELGIRAVYKTVDTCGAEFDAYTPYLYSTYEGEDESALLGSKGKRKIVILGGGPNRIGQGIEFDYCCVHAAFALREDGFETIMVNCNPETVSTDYDTSDKLFFEPLTLEDVLAIVHREKPERRDRPVRRPDAAQARGAARARGREDHRHVARLDRPRRGPRALRGRCSTTLDLKRPPNGIARSPSEAIAVAERIGYPVLVRPSYVLGGRAMEIVYDATDLERYMREAVRVSPEHPVLIDHFLEDAIEVDVDAVSDGTDVVIGGIMEHIERAGVHSGDSACSLPPNSIAKDVQDEIRRQTVALARELGVVGLMNVQFAVKESVVYILEVNPRASRTVPFVSKAIGVPLAKIAARVMVGKTLRELGVTTEIVPRHVSVKEAVFPFLKFPGVDTLLGPEMKSTGEVMGIDGTFGCRSRRRRSPPARCCRSAAKSSSRCSTPTSRPRSRSPSV